MFGWTNNARTKSKVRDGSQRFLNFAYYLVPFGITHFRKSKHLPGLHCVKVDVWIGNCSAK